jgi:hypothetical protein
MGGFRLLGSTGNEEPFVNAWVNWCWVQVLTARDAKAGRADLVGGFGVGGVGTVCGILAGFSNAQR